MADDKDVLRQAQHDRDEDPILTGRNGKLQRRRRKRRKLFGKTAKAAFLESFACTANAAASADAIGFSVGAVFTHRRTDPVFRDQYWETLEQALGKLVALRIQHEIERAEGRLDPGIEARLDGPPDARQIADLVKLMAALRDLTRNLAGGERAGKAAAPHAGLDEVCAALAKRLKAFPPSFDTGFDKLTPTQDEREKGDEPGA
ncbi:MAG TPA: hypothetical protein VK403_02750 [Allosphingosinicella sp.]|nr:hypothetical protein [Allosphingosinicella sp.]